MKHPLLLTALLTLLATTGAARQYIYRPEPLDPPRNGVPVTEGVLVTEITIERGDTLFGLARRHLGRGIFYPQILLFNDIPNPDLIYAGKTLRIPVPPDADTQPVASPVRKRQLPDPVVPARKAEQPPPSPPIAQPEQAPPTADEGLFGSAVAAYKQGDCRTAVELFDRFLGRTPGSPLAADALLYRADCFLKLSGE